MVAAGFNPIETNAVDVELVGISVEAVREALGAAVPVFLISGDTAPGSLSEASAGGFHLLHKPVSPMALGSTLNRLLKANDARGPSRRSSAVEGEP